MCIRDSATSVTEKPISRGDIMPPRAKYTREEITEIALGIVAESGVESLDARSLAEAMGTSTRPIFTAFRNMEELESAVRESAMKVFGQFAEKETPDMPAFKQVGIQMITFAKEKPKLFRLLFMKEQDHTFNFEGMFSSMLGVTADKCIEYIMNDYSLSKEDAMTLFRHVWIFTYGIGVLLSSNICLFSENEISDMLSVQFRSMLIMIKSSHAAK